jgi:hypothetical protein
MVTKGWLTVDILTLAGQEITATAPLASAVVTTVPAATYNLANLPRVLRGRKSDHLRHNLSPCVQHHYKKYQEMRTPHVREFSDTACPGSQVEQIYRWS